MFLNLLLNLFTHEHVMGKQILPKQINTQDFWILGINRIKILIETLCKWDWGWVEGKQRGKSGTTVIA